MNAVVCRTWVGRPSQLGCWLLLTVLTLWAGGCTSHPNKQIPPGWHALTDTPTVITPVKHANADAPDANAPAHDTLASPNTTSSTPATTARPSRMQVFICYGWMTSNHACMRLDGPGDQSLFWDPGGGYGQDDPNVPIKRDLLLDDDALTVEQLWDYRVNGCNEPAMLMFEWHLTEEQARARRAILIHGQTKNDPQGSFDSDVPGGFCAMAVSSFLKRFSSDNITLPRRWFWPHNLAKQLWRNHPDRVLLFERHKPVVVYVPSDKAVTQLTINTQLPHAP